jgi:general secretion pathway protein E
MLVDVQAIPESLYLPVVSRVKLLASLDIAERRQPQDGRYSIDRAGRHFDARVSAIPTISGERLAIRLLDMRARIPTLEALGMELIMLAEYRRAIHNAHGFVVVCGPTGSGKTTTLYASLAERNVVSQHVCSVEDPVEVRMHGIAQVQVNPRAGVTFASALRAFLRQDPNVIMLGEMRDEESARVALSASLSGQMVLTTLHAGDAARSIERLAELGLSRQTLSSGLTAVVGQRLLRKLCERCKRGIEPMGCNACDGTGYRGRIGVFELLVITDEMRHAIANGEPTWRLTALAGDYGYEPMLASARRRMASGDTSLSEIQRVLGEGKLR